MIEFKTGDLLKDDAEALVNSVNCVGVMGRGVALQFKRAFPDNFRIYQRACRRGEVRPGHMLVVETDRLTHPRFIINFPTKRHWRGKSRLEDIEAGLEDLVQVIAERRIRSIALPPLGSGLGGLDWKTVRPLIETSLADLPDVRVSIYEPHPGGEARKLPPGRAPRMTPGRAALIGLMSAYLRALMDPIVALLEVHKLMYFMQEAGEQLKLRFVKAPYGPYAENLRHVLQDVEAHYTVGYTGVDAPTTEISLVPGALEEAEAALVAAEPTRARLARVVDLVHGFETPHGLELLSSVHWLVAHEGAISRSEVTRQLHAWNPRKQRFTAAQINLALDTLTAKAWIPPVEA